MTLSLSKIVKGEANLWLAAVSITLAALALAVVLDVAHAAPAPELPLLVSDNVEYFEMAEGEGSEVIAPFSRRVLYPFLARGLSLGSGLSVRSAFILLDVSTVFLLTYFLARILVLFDLSPWMAAIFMLTPLPIDCAQNGYMPDLFHAMLVAFFFLLILREKFLFALLVLAAAYLARENTLILCLVLGIVAWLRKLRRVAIGSGLVILYGTALGAWAVRRGQSNIHHLPDFLYLALKMPFNFFKNVCGFRIWTNTLPFGEPFTKFTLPDYLRSGDVRVLGPCYPEWELPSFTLISLLTLFGTGPLIVWSMRRIKPWTEPHPVGIQVAFVYGLVAFFLGTSIGDWVDRLIGYGWPLFWIGVPYLLSVMKREHQDLRAQRCLLSMWGVAWIPTVLGYSRGSSFFIGVLTLLAVALAYGLTWRQVQRTALAEDKEIAAGCSDQEENND